VTALSQRLKDRFFGENHPYSHFETEVDALINPASTLLDAGCGRTAPVLRKYRGRAGRLIGVDVVDFRDSVDGIELHRSDLGAMPLDDACVDVAMARSVMEHVNDPARVYAEMYRVLKPGGHFVFLTPNLWDYGSLIAKAIPNRAHPWIVSKTEGREEEDVFPIAYRTNTNGAVRRWAKRTGFETLSIRYLGQYPSYFWFNGFLFLLATAYEKVIANTPGLRFLQGWLLVTLRKPASAGRRGGEREATSSHPAAPATAVSAQACSAQPPTLSRAIPAPSAGRPTA
jgi:ubiquinone/menaquinone biosynthesis C-methylase UbiE